MATLDYDSETSSLVPETSSFGIVFNTLLSTSPLSGVIKTVEVPGARWRGVLNFSELTPAESAGLKKLLLKLRGMSGRLALKDYGHENATPPDGTITVSSTSGTTQVTFGITGYTSGGLSEGDYFTIGNDDARELKLVTNVVSGSGSTQTYDFEPPLRVSTANNYDTKVVDVNNPKGVFHLTTDDQALWSVIGKAKLSNITLEVLEALEEV